MSKGANTKEKIAIAAANLINTQGYHGMSLNELMDVTGLKKGGIYNHYDTKESIALDALDNAFIRILERFKERFESKGNAAEKLQSIFLVFASYASRPLNEGPFVLIGMSIHAESISQAYQKKVRDAQKKLEYFIQVIIAEGIETGIFKREIDALASMKYITASLYGGLLCSYTAKDLSYMLVICDNLSIWLQAEIIKRPIGLL